MSEQLIQVLEVLIPGPPGSPGSPTGNVDGVFITSGHIVQEDGEALAQRRYLNFVGGTVTDDAANDATVVTLPTGGGGTGGGDPTNLTYTAATRVLESSTGTDVTLPVVTPSLPGLASAADKTKLDGVATGATANATDSQLRDRSTHTGTQASSTISDFAASSRAQVEGALVAGTNITLTPAGSGASRTLTISAAGGGAGATNLSITNRGANTLDVASDTGTDATIPAATTSLAGLASAADKAKLDTIAPGATANATNAQLLDRGNHTGTQAWSTIASTPTTLTGYGITDAQPLDSDLTAIAALSTTAFGRGLLTLADAAALRTAAGLSVAVVSDVTGITGADRITNMVSLTQAEYDAITPNASTFYVIV